MKRRTFLAGLLAAPPAALGVALGAKAVDDANVTIAGEPTDEDIFTFELSRDLDGDMSGEDIRLHGIKITYETDPGTDFNFTIAPTRPAG